MGCILYRDPTKATETDEEMWTSPLNSYLREHDFSCSGGIRPVPEVIDHVREIGALWWNYTCPRVATFGTLRFNGGGIVGLARSPLIDSRELFTACAVEGLTALQELLAGDRTRRDTYGDDHADLLTLAFSFNELVVEEYGDHLFTDGTVRRAEAGAVIATFTLGDVPLCSAPEHFHLGGRYPSRTRVSTIGRSEQARAVQAGWKKAADSASIGGVSSLQ